MGYVSNKLLFDKIANNKLLVLLEKWQGNFFSSFA